MFSVYNLRLVRGRKIVLDAFQQRCASGQGAWLTGPNGAGKSSVLRALAGLLPPAAGTIERALDFIYIGTAHGHDAQLTVGDNLAFWAGLHGVDQKHVAAALDAAGLAELKTHKAGQLSAGQSQRLALARVLLKPASLWLLDEPTSHLDAAGQGWVQGLIQQQLQNKGIVIAASHAPLAIHGMDEWSLAGGAA